MGIEAIIGLRTEGSDHEESIVPPDSNVKMLMHQHLTIERGNQKICYKLQELNVQNQKHQKIHLHP